MQSIVDKVLSGRNCGVDVTLSGKEANELFEALDAALNGLTYADNFIGSRPMSERGSIALKYVREARALVVRLHGGPR